MYKNPKYAKQFDKTAIAICVINSVFHRIYFHEHKTKCW